MTQKDRARERAKGMMQYLQMESITEKDRAECEERLQKLIKNNRLVEEFRREGLL